MATANVGLPILTGGEPYSLKTIHNNLANAVDSAFGTFRFFVGTSSARAQFVTDGKARVGDHWQDTNGSQYEYVYKSTGWVQLIQSPGYAFGSPLVGNAWDGTSPIITKAASVVANSGSGAVANVNFAGGAFPNGLFSVTLTNGDNSAFGGVLNVFGTTLARVQITPKNFDGSNATNVNFRGNYIAIGW